MSNNIKFHFFLVSSALMVKLIAIFYTNFDLFGDEAQYWLWAKEIDMGYYSKPPLLAWSVGIFTFIFGNSFVSIKFIPLIFYIATCFVIYLTTLELYKNKELAIFSGLSFFLLPSVTVSSFLLSTDVVLILFWCLSLLQLIKIRSNPNLINFLFLGIFLGFSFLAKYAAIYFVLSLFIIFFFNKKIKNCFFKNFKFFFVFLITLIIIFLPNIIWNLNNEWVTLNHTSDNAGLSRSNINLFQGVEFILIQSLMIGPVLFFSFVFFIRKMKIDFETKFLLIFSLPVFLIVLVESILVRANANWAAIGLISIYILALKQVYTNAKKILKINNYINYIFCFIFFILIAQTYPLKVFDRINGITDFSNLLKKNHIKENEYLVVSDRLLYSNLKYIYREFKMNIMTPYKPSDKITSHFHISSPLPEGFNKKFIFIGSPSHVDYLKDNKKIIKIDSIDVLFKNHPVEIYEVLF